MFNILLVDDEPLMRSALRSIVDWKKIGFRIAGEAHNGLEALKIINSTSVDVVLTDLKMPVMGGLELISNANSISSDITFVVLSAYDEFHMVSDAFKLGVKEYILKAEMTSEQLLVLMGRIKDQIMKRRESLKKSEEQKKQELEERKQFEEMKGWLKEKNNAIKEKILKEIIWGDTVIDNKRIQQLQLSKLRIFTKQVQVVVLAVEDDIGRGLMKPKNNSATLKFDILDVLTDILDKHQMGEVFFNIPGEYVILLSSDDSIQGFHIAREKINRIFSEMYNQISHRFDLVVSGGLSEVVSGYKDVKLLHYQASQSCRYRFVRGRGRLIEYEFSFSNKSVDSLAKLYEKRRRLRETLKSVNLDNIGKASKLFCIKESEVLPHQINQVKQLFIDYQKDITEFAEQYHFSFMLSDLMKEFELLSDGFGTLYELNNWLEKVFNCIEGIIDGSSQIINKAKTYIHQHYKEGIFLTTVADELAVNNSYLSRKFKEKEGCNFSDYLTMVRVEAAIEYIKGAEMKIYEIAELVGYSSIESFSRAFKNYTGKSPKQYLV